MEPEQNDIIEEVAQLKRVLLSQLGDFIVPVVSLVSEPSVPLARYISIKSADTGGSMDENEIKNAHILKLLRMRAGLNQSQLARMVGVAQNSISAWEAARSGVPREVALKMAGPLKIDAEALEFATGLAAIKAKGQSADPRTALYAASSAYELSQDQGLSENQRRVAAQLCADLLRSVEDALGIDGEATVEELPVATRSYEPTDDRYEAAARDAEGRPLDPYRDLRIAGLMPPGENDRDEDRYRDLGIAGLLPPRTNGWRPGNVS